MTVRNALVWIAILVSAVVAGAAGSAGVNAVLGVVLAVSPEARADRLLLSHVVEVKGWVTSYYNTSHGKMPPTLLAAALASGVTAKEMNEYVDDPAAHSAVRYRRGNGSAYTLCVTFQEKGAYPGDFSRWNHPAGPQCFTFDATDQGTPRTPRLDGQWWSGC